MQVVKALPDGKLLIGGNFTNVSGQAGMVYVARLNSDGTVDTSFVSQAGGSVNEIALVGDDYWLSGGSSYAGNNRNVRIDSTGAVASGFNYNGSMVADKMVPTSDRGVVLGANSYPYIQKVDGNGILDSSCPNLAGGSGGGPNGQVYELANLGADRTIVTGGFSSYSGGPASNIMVVDANGDPEPDFVPETGFNGSYPLDVKTDSLRRIWCAGSFTSYKGEIVSRVVVLNGYDPLGGDPFVAYSSGLPIGQQGEGDDPDRDGQSNLVEFAYNTLAADPTSCTRLKDTAGVVGSNEINILNPGSNLPAGQSYYTITFRFPDNPQ